MGKKIWIAVLFAVVTTFSMFAISVSADIVASGDCGNSVKWTLDDVGTLTISGSGDMWDYNSSPFSGHEKDIKYVVIEDGVTSIGNYAFYQYNNYQWAIERIKIGNSVRRIGTYAFYNCDYLTNVKIPLSVTTIADYAFYSCNSLSQVEIFDGVEVIGDYAFAACPTLSKAKLGNNVKKIQKSTFEGCSSLMEISLSSSLEYIGESVFRNCTKLPTIIIPPNIKRIENNLFENCSTLKVIQLNSGIDSIGRDAFKGCKLDILYFSGTESQWNEIFIAQGNDTLNVVKKVFSNTSEQPPVPSVTPTIPGTNSDNRVLVYDANGGIEPPIPVTAKNGEAVTVSTEKLSRIGYEFLGWAKQSSAVAAEYTGGESLTLSDNITLYAVWKKIGGYSVEMVLTIDSNNAKVNGADAYTDVAPIIENSRTMLPARFVAEKLGASVAWDDAERKVTITGADGTVIEIIIDSTTAYVNGEAFTLDAPAFIRNSRTYTPVRFICDNLGADVGWDGEKREVTIRK